MAVAYLAPADSDLITVKEAVDLFRPTPLAPSESTLKRWIKEHGLRTEKIGRAHYVSHSDLLEVHRDEVHHRQAGQP